MKSSTIPSPRRWARAVWFVAVAIALAMTPVQLTAQSERDSFAGGLGGFGLGAVGGLVIGAGVLTTRAIVFGEPYYGGAEIESWVYANVAIAAAATSMYGAAHSDDLGSVALWSGAGMAAGGALGFLVGNGVDRDRRFGWASMGAAAGLLTGAILYMATDEADDETGLGTSVSLLQLSVP